MFSSLWEDERTTLRTNKFMIVSLPSTHAVRSSSADFNPKSYDITAYELTNPLHCINFSCFEYKIFLKDLKSTLSSSVASCFRNLDNAAITTKLTELSTCSTYLFLCFPDSMRCFLPGIYTTDVHFKKSKSW